MRSRQPGKSAKRAQERIPRLRGMKGFPIMSRTSMRYAEVVNLSGVAGALNTYQFALNGLFDPNITGSGHQPIGYDQWNVFFRNYLVHGARFKITPFVTSASVNPIFGWYVTDDTTITTSSATTLIEQGKSRWNLLLYLSTIQPVPSMSGTFSSREWFQVEDLHDAVASYGAPITSNPSNIAYLTLFCQDFGLVGTASVRVLVEIDYDAEFFEPQELPQS
jgi:hypothetical protein